ncbi:MAG TPA: DJ-1/PfpI family protein [Azospirillaceae bacterium]|nr:DJ-1/PfpI family protein [Azospirillaceae bacterium]
MDQPLAGKSIAILVANGFEETEMTESQRALLKAGAAVRVISVEKGLVNGWQGKGWGHYFPVDKMVGEALGADYDMLLLPGGERSTAKLSQSAHTRRIVGHFLDARKPIAAMDAGIELLAIQAKLKGRTLTSLPQHREAVEAAGATWVDESLVEDKATVTARGVENLPAFVEAVIRVFGEAAQIKNAA